MQERDGTDRVKHWTRVAVTAALLALCVGLALRSSDLPQCCDSVRYHDEAISILALDPAESLGTDHNYGYGAWLAVLYKAALTTRAEVAVAQVTALLASLVFISFQIPANRHTFLNWLLLLVGVPMAWSYSGFTMTEALIAPIAIALLALLWRLISQDPNARPIKLVVAIGVSAGALWAVRPGLLWLPVITAVAVPFLHQVSSGERPRITLRARSYGYLAMASSAIAAIPQLFIARSLGATISNGVLHLQLAAAQRLIGPSVWRYATNLSGCGDTQAYFSPHAQNQTEAWAAARGGLTVLDKLTSALFHVVSVLDPTPAPGFAARFEINSFVLLTLLAGFILAPTLWSLIHPIRNLVAGATRATLTTWSLLAMLTLAAAAPTGAEYRFGILAIISMGCVAALSLTTAIGPRWKMWFWGTLLSTATLIGLTMLTLQTSEAWKTCSL